jgi:uncharacterized protein YndB with AHSA1/START domain
MTKATSTPPIGNGQAPIDLSSDWPRMSALDRAEQEIPRLHTPGAFPMVRDRWERLVTAIDLPCSPEMVWESITKPEALQHWFALTRGSIASKGTDTVLDFEDGEFFLCHTLEAQSPHRLHYLWRWLGIGQATSVIWELFPTEAGTRLVVTEEAKNAPWDWQTWNGGGWPGILDQLAAYMRTGMSWRWPWRRMGPYAQVELPLSVYEAWDQLFSPNSLKYWLLTMNGALVPGEKLPVFMGDASGMVEMTVNEVVPPGQAAPSFLPYVTFSLNRPVWNCNVQGRIWIDPSGWRGSILQALLFNWENLPADLQLSERRILTGFWAAAAQRACMLCSRPQSPEAGHGWS